MAGYIDIPAAIKQAEQLLKEKEELFAKIEIIRTDLRHAVVMGGATEDQKKWVAEKFPTVKRTRKPKGTANGKPATPVAA
jgi:uncharacterized protein (UPF0303 family)